MRDERGQTATEFLGMLLIVAAIVFALASPKVAQPIRDAFRGQTEAVATEGEDGGRTKRTDAARDRRATPTPTPAATSPATGTRTQQLSRRLNALEEELRSTKLPRRSTEYQQLQLERNQVAAAYAEARRRERRRTGSGERD